MPDEFEEQAVLVAAEQAAAEGDATAAEGHLRKLLDLQTARLGPGHPDVASTLHNLAVVCERAGRIGDAEGLYRRAFEVAAGALPPQDPLVVRCQEDLNAFLDARVMPVRPTAAPPAPARATPSSGVRRPPSSASRAPARPSSRVRPPAPPPAPSPSRRWIGVAAAVAVVGAAAIAWMTLDRGNAEPPASQPVAPAAAAAPPKAATRKTTPATAAPASAPATTPAPLAAPPPEPPPADVPDSAGATVTDARLCRTLSTSGGWTCTPPEEPVGAGRLSFLTRVVTSSAVQVEHRWYHGNAVIQAVRLRIPPAGAPGYRTYSRQTVGDGRTGEWRVELRLPDGTVLHEQRFTVQ